MDSSFTESSVDLFQRYHRYCSDAAAQRLFPNFRSLSAWHFRASFCLLWCWFRA